MPGDAVVYADASALVKLAVSEAESAALRQALAPHPRLYTSRLATVEVTRAALVANPATGFRQAARLLEACELIDVDAGILDGARRLVSRELRALDAIHLASALLVEPDAFLAYDRRLLAAADRAGLQTASPGA